MKRHRKAFGLIALAALLAPNSPLALAQNTDDQRDELRHQLIGWYEADRGRRLTVLPAKKQLISVFDWANGAPTSLGKMVVNHQSEVTFKQPKSTTAIELKRQDGAIQSLSAIDIDFVRQSGVDGAVGKYANDQGQTLELSHRGSGLRCTIDWRNNAPKTIGTLVAAPAGHTALVGHNWQETISLDFNEGAVKAITIVGAVFTRVEE